MHDDEIHIDERLIRKLIDAQFPEWSALPIQRVEPSGTVTAIFRLGEALSVRLPRIDGPTSPRSVELEWLPRLAPLLPMDIPLPIAQGSHPRGIHGSGRSIRG